jgi:hypothetical protein
LNTSHISDHDSLRLREIRRLERIFIYHRWLYIVAILLLAAVYRELPITAIIILSLFLGICNIITWRIYRNLDTVKKQTTLSLCMLAADGLASWGLMLLFLRDPTAIVYAVFALIVIEGAVRFGLTGSLLTGTFFIVGLSTAWILRVSLLDMSFDWAAYIFWEGLITLISIMIGMVVRESLKQRAYAESLSTEKTLLLERRRISLSLKQANQGVDIAADDFDPSLYGMTASYDENGNYIYPEGFDPETNEWKPGFEEQQAAWEAQYAEAQARWLALKKQAADAEESAVAAARAEATEYTSDATPVEGSLASDEALQALRNKLTSGS